jgi:sigma-B regulation protein RsbU (phosphoserine phosphatase)
MTVEEKTHAELLAEISRLEQELEFVKQEKLDLEILLDTTTEHSTEIEKELQEKNEEVESLLKALRRELEVGRQIQSDFLPDNLPSVAKWEMAARFQPAREVAGDFYDAFSLPGDRLGIVIADVCDKGVGAALFMALTRSLLRALALQAYSRLQFIGTNAENYLIEVNTGQKTSPKLVLPAYTYEILNTVGLVNDYINANHSRSDMFATLFFGVIDTKNNTISYVNAGHDLPMIIGNEGVKERLLTCGPAVGMLPNIKYKMNQAQIEPGDIILAYTDGIPEARDPEGNLYSQPKLIELITRLTAEGVSTLNGFVDNILLEVKNHVATAEPSDDVTMIAARYLG